MSRQKDLLMQGALVLSGSTVMAVAGGGSALAACDSTSISGGSDCAKGNDQKSDLVENIRVITNTMLFAIGVVAVIMLVIGGFRYVFSGGNSTNTTAAKDTILYAVVGIVVALLAYAIVNFVLGQFSVTA